MWDAVYEGRGRGEISTVGRGGGRGARGAGRGARGEGRGARGEGRGARGERGEGREGRGARGEVKGEGRRARGRGCERACVSRCFLSLNTDTCSWTASTVYRSLPTETNTEQEKRNNTALASYIYNHNHTGATFFPIPAVDFTFLFLTGFFSLRFFFFCSVMLRFSYIRGAAITQKKQKKREAI